MSELTAELIADMKFIQDVQLSPDGKRIAYVLVGCSKAEAQETSQIWVVSVDGMEPPRPWTSSLHRDSNPRWSPDGEALAFLSDRDEPGVSSLYLLPSRCGEAIRLVDDSGDVAVWGPIAAASNRRVRRRARIVQSTPSYA